MKKNIRLLLLATTLLLAAGENVLAASVTYNLNYSGAFYSNSAVGTGYITFDDALLANTAPQIWVSAASLGITDFQLMISGTTGGSGDGTFGLADYSGGTDWLWNISSILTPEQLVGQSGFNSFNFQSSNMLAPSGLGGFTIAAGNGSGEQLELTSMSTPIPAAVWLFGTGLVGLMRFRKKVVI